MTFPSVISNFVIPRFSFLTESVTTNPPNFILSFEVVAKGMPYGLGSYINADGKLQARITQAMMSVNAFKGVEVGAGFASSAVFGSELHDEILFENDKITRSRNNAGGIEGGMSNAQPIHVKVSMKPISTLIKPLISIDLNTM